ncbi:MAG: hypothetical protein KH828_10190 [Clostridiales bacterium]|nr:hypothetical protein [Clostridiales bacterium]
MDIDALVNEICKRVQEKIDSAEKQQAADERPRILILTNAHGTDCHETLECPVLGEYYRTECTLMKNYECDMEDYEAVIAYTLTNEALGKIANGIFDDGYTRLFGKAVLSGKKIFIPEEEVELYRYKTSAPAAYYERIEAGLKLLLKSGVVIAKKKELQALILNGQEAPEVSAEPETDKKAEAREQYFFKRVITEKDVTSADRDKVEILVIDNKAILTDLAREYVSKRKMTIVRQELSSAKRGQRR